MKGMRPAGIVDLERLKKPVGGANIAPKFETDTETSKSDTPGRIYKLVTDWRKLKTGSKIEIRFIGEIVAIENKQEYPFIVIRTKAGIKRVHPVEDPARILLEMSREEYELLTKEV